MQFSYLLAIHIVFVVSWFAALFYIVRLFIYTVEAQQKEPAARLAVTEQLLLMQRKLWNIIGWPAMAGTIIFGTWVLLLNYTYYLSQPWMWLKLISVVILIFYHLQCQRILNMQKRGQYTISSFRLRLFNELATVLLVAIVFLVVVKSTSGLLWGVLGLTGFAGTMMIGVMLYRRSRLRESAEKARQ